MFVMLPSWSRSSNHPAARVPRPREDPSLCQLDLHWYECVWAYRSTRSQYRSWCRHTDSREWEDCCTGFVQANWLILWWCHPVQQWAPGTSWEKGRWLTSWSVLRRSTKRKWTPGLSPSGNEQEGAVVARWPEIDCAVSGMHRAKLPFLPLLICLIAFSADCVREWTDCDTQRGSKHENEWVSLLYQSCYTSWDVSRVSWLCHWSDMIGQWVDVSVIWVPFLSWSTYEERITSTSFSSTHHPLIASEFSTLNFLHNAFVRSQTLPWHACYAAWQFSFTYHDEPTTENNHLRMQHHRGSRSTQVWDSLIAYKHSGYHLLL